jgi:hypothetical protein
MSDEPCGTCGGDRRIANSFGLTTTCPTCRGTGRRVETTGFHDVTKTKESHYRPTNRAATAPAKPQWPGTFEGERLATEVKESASLTADDKAKLIREIIDHEATHGSCTKTFLKKIRKQFRPRTT